MQKSVKTGLASYLAGRLFSNFEDNFIILESFNYRNKKRKF